jgi:hypothetical protein
MRSSGASRDAAQLVNEELRAMGDLVPSVPDHHQEMGYTEQRGQILMTLPPVPEAGGKHTGGSDATYRS